MAVVNETLAALRIGGDALDPAEVTRLLGHAPSLAQTKGQEIGRNSAGEPHFAKIGQWQLEASNRSPGDLDAQIDEILSQLSDDLAVWSALTSQYEADLFCGLLLQVSDEGLTLSPKSLAALGSRGIELGLCIYSGKAETPNTSLERTRGE